jgi:hypothetical protein
MSLKDEAAAKEISTQAGLNAKSITGLTAYRNGSINVLEVKHSTGTVFIKSYLGRMEYGGDASWGSGTEIPLP